MPSPSNSATADAKHVGRGVPRQSSFERELARTKRRNPRLLAVGGLALGVLALAWIVAGAVSSAQIPARGSLLEQVTKVPAVIRARRFVLVDANGKTGAMLTADKDGPRLDLFDENGKIRATLEVSEDGPGLALFDEKGEVRAMLAAETWGRFPCFGL